MSAGEEKVGHRSQVSQERVDALEVETRIWSPACSIFWALWGITMAEEQVQGMVQSKDFVPEFDYLVSWYKHAANSQSYALERLEMFREEARDVGVPLP